MESLGKLKQKLLASYPVLGVTLITACGGSSSGDLEHYLFLDST